MSLRTPAPSAAAAPALLRSRPPAHGRASAGRRQTRPCVARALPRDLVDGIPDPLLKAAVVEPVAFASGLLAGAQPLPSAVAITNNIITSRSRSLPRTTRRVGAQFARGAAGWLDLAHRRSRLASGRGRTCSAAAAAAGAGVEERSAAPAHCTVRTLLFVGYGLPRILWLNLPCRRPRRAPHRQRHRVIAVGQPPRELEHHLLVAVRVRAHVERARRALPRSPHLRAEARVGVAVTTTRRAAGR